MKLLCLVALAVCAVAHGVNPQEDVLPTGATKHFEKSQYEVRIPSPKIEEISDTIPAEYESVTEAENRIISGAIKDALEELRDIVINGNDNFPILDPLEVSQLGPAEYSMTGIRVRGTLNNLRAEGLRWFVADRITISPLRLTVGITLTVPWLTVTGAYDAGARIGLLSHNAGGNIRIFANRIEVSVDMRMGANIWSGHLLLRELVIKIDIYDTQISITGMTGSSVLNSIISATIQSVTQDLVQSQLENVSQMLSEELFSTVDSVLRDFTVSDIFG